MSKQREVINQGIDLHYCHLPIDQKTASLQDFRFRLPGAEHLVKDVDDTLLLPISSESEAEEVFGVVIGVESLCTIEIDFRTWHFPHVGVTGAEYGSIDSQWIKTWSAWPTHAHVSNHPFVVCSLDRVVFI